MSGGRQSKVEPHPRRLRGAQQFQHRVMVAGDQHRIIVIGTFELRLQHRIILDHQQNMLFGPPTHRQLASFITASALRAPESACGSRKAKKRPFNSTEERREGKESVSKRRTRGTTDKKKQKTKRD